MRPYKFRISARKKKCTYTILFIFARTSRNILRKHWDAPRIPLKDANNWLSVIIYITLSWFWRQPTVISVWYCFLSVKWTALATTFLSVQSNARNIYRRSEANLPSHHFNLECRYLGGVILSFLSLLRWFSLVDKLLKKIKLPSLALR